MMRARVFAGRIFRELWRDPLSYVFCLGFPIVMLGLMTVINQSIPPQAGMTVFQIQNLTPGIAMFSYSFVMLFGALQLSKDRSSALLIRLYASPLRAVDFLAGYALPLLAIGAAQTAVTYGTGALIAALAGQAFPFAGAAVSWLVFLPTLLLFIGLGLLFGALLSDKAAPGVASIFITLSALLGGCWMDVAAIGGVMERICRIFPFYPAVNAARAAVAGDYAAIWPNLPVLTLWTIGALALAVWVFHRRMRSDLS